MKKTLIIFVLLAAVVAGAFGVLNHNKSKKTEALQKRKSVVMEVPVKLSVVGEQSLDRNIKINGVLSARKQVTILAEGAGQVKRFYKDVGDTVKVGTQLALIDGLIVSTQLETARASLANNQRDLERFKRLAQSGAATQQTVDNLTLAVESAKAQVTMLEKQVSNTIVRSPQNGVIVRRMVEIGSVVGGGAPTFMVADLSEMQMTVGLTEREIVQVKQGMPAKVRIDALGKDFNAVINTVGIAADASGRFPIDVLITEKTAKGLLRPDLAGTVSLDLPALDNAITIPREALIDGVKDPKVYVIKDGKANMRRLDLGVVQGSNAIVNSGLALGEQVVITGHQNLFENAAVRVIQ